MEDIIRYYLPISQRVAITYAEELIKAGDRLEQMPEMGPKEPLLEILNRNYRYVYRRGKSTPSRSVVLIHLKGREQRFGFSVSGKVGNAVTRNRIRRYMREDVRRMRTQLKSGKYVFIARQGIDRLTVEQDVHLDELRVAEVTDVVVE